MSKYKCIYHKKSDCLIPGGGSKHKCPICGTIEIKCMYRSWCSGCGWQDFPRAILKCPNPCKHCTWEESNRNYEKVFSEAKKRWKERKNG